MRTIQYLTLLFFFILSLPIKGQDILEINYEKLNYDEKDRSSISVLVGPPSKEVKKAWIDYLKDNYDVKLKGMGLFANKDVLSAEKVTIEKLSNKRIDFFTKVVEEGDYTKMNVFAAYGYDININPDEYPSVFQTMDEMLVGFLESFIPNYYQEKVTATTERLEEVRKDREKLKDDLSDNESDIEKYQSKIADLKEENQALEQELKINQTNLDEVIKLLKTREAALQKAESQLEGIK